MVANGIAITYGIFQRGLWVERYYQFRHPLMDGP